MLYAGNVSSGNRFSFNNNVNITGGITASGSINSDYIKATNSINASRTGDYEAFTAQLGDVKKVIIKAGGDGSFEGNKMQFVSNDFVLTKLATITSNPHDIQQLEA